MDVENNFRTLKRTRHITAALREKFLVPYLLLALTGIAGVYLKLSLLQKNWLAIERVLTAQHALSIKHALEFVSWDLLLNFYVIPLVGILIFLPLKKWRIRYVLTSTCALIFFYFVQLQAQESLGQYMSLQMLYEALMFAISEPNQASEYMRFSALAKLIGMCSIALMISPLVHWLSEAWPRVVYSLVISMIIMLTLTLALILNSLPERMYGLNVASVHRIASTVFEVRSDEDEVTDLAQSLDRFRKLTQTKVATKHSVDGQEKGSDLLMFVLETAPASVVNEDIQLILPESLRQHTLVAQEHYSTYPYTSDALYSIFTGLYPTGRRDVIKKGWIENKIGIITALRKQDYITATYSPKIYNADRDLDMFDQLGFSRNFVAANEADTEGRQIAAREAAQLMRHIISESPAFDAAQRAGFEERLANDLFALSQLRQDIISARKAGRKFAFAYFPQVGHGPWPQLGAGDSLRSASRYLVELQMDWLESIVSTLREVGALEETVLLITSDHGVRTRNEYPSLPIGSISHHSFQVPMAIYAPNAFNEPQIIDSPTSHIDIQPTLAALFGTDGIVESVQGIPVWHAHLNRQLFFFARGYGGADGFKDGGFFMQNDITGVQLCSDKMDFSPLHSRPANAEEKEYIGDKLREFQRVHYSILSSLRSNDEA